MKFYRCLDCPNSKDNLIRVDVDDQESVACPLCGGERTEIAPQWYINFVKAWRKSTGPTSKEGKETSSRNATTHGRYSHTVIYPAKPDKYPECINCPYKETCIQERDDGKPNRFCYLRNEKVMKFYVSIKNGTLDLVEEEAALKLAKINILMDDMISVIQEKGLLLPVMRAAKDGELYSEDKANPLISELVKLMKELGYTATDWGITRKSAKEDKLLDKAADAMLSRQERDDLAAAFLKRISGGKSSE